MIMFHVDLPGCRESYSHIFLELQTTFLFFDGCFNWMIPNHYIKKIGCFTKHSLKDGRLGYKVTLPKTGKAFAPQKKAGPQKETASCIPTIHFRVRTDDPPENRASQKEIHLPTIEPGNTSNELKFILGIFALKKHMFLCLLFLSLNVFVYQYIG